MIDFKFIFRAFMDDVRRRECNPNTHTQTHAGALLAFLLLRDIFGPLAYGFIFGLVGGMMVIVALKDLLPAARKFAKHEAVVTAFFILGMFIMAVNTVFFEDIES